MSSERAARALMTLGQSLGNIAKTRSDREATDLEALRQQSLEELRHGHRMTEDSAALTAKTAADTAAEGRRETFESTENEKQRTFQGAQTDKSIGAQDRQLGMRDRQLVESDATDQLAALTKRVQTVTDQQRSGELFGDAATDAASEVAQAHDQMRSIKARMIRSLAGMGDPRYKDMGLRDILLAAGYSRDEIASQMRSAAPAAEAPPTDAGTVAAPSTAPTSPEPLRDLTKEGRPKKAAEPRVANRTRGGLPTHTVQTRGGPQEMVDIGKTFETHQGQPTRYAPGRGTMPAKELAPPPEDVKALKILEMIRAGSNVQSVEGINKIKSRSPAELRKLGFTEQEMIKLRSYGRAQ